MMFRAKVYVSLKNGVLDPQGEAVGRALANLGYVGVGPVRMGKLIEVDLEAPDATAARAAVEEMARRLLANPVLEEFHFDLEEVSR